MPATYVREFHMLKRRIVAVIAATVGALTLLSPSSNTSNQARTTSAKPTGSWSARLSIRPHGLTEAAGVTV